MKGLLSSRLLKGPGHSTGMKKLSNSLYRRGRLRKRIRSAIRRKSVLGYPKPEKQLFSSVFAEGQEEAAKEDLHDEGVVGHVDDNHDDDDDDEDGDGHDDDVMMIEDRVKGRDCFSNLQVEEEAATTNEAFPVGPIISAEWEAAVQSIVKGSAPIAFICGGKNTGKSTFARYLVNSLLNRYSKVGFLDTDVGQPELTPSSCLSLHVLDKPILGLPALEMKNPERCYFFGDISPKTNPEDYLKSVFSLYDHFQNKYYLNLLEGEVNLLKEGRFPLVINTHGWIQGIGFDVLVGIIGHVVPTHIVQILSKTASRNLPPNRFWESKTTRACNAELLYVNSALGGSTQSAEIKFNAQELRDLRFVSYFQKGLKDKRMQTSKLPSLFTEAAIALASFKPFQVPISAIKVVHQHYQVPACESIYSLNAALVGLGVSSVSGNCDKGSLGINTSCIGLGIVRGVDVQKGLFYVITPLSLEELQQVDTFLQGKMEIPVTLLKAPGYVSPYLCPNTISIEGTGSASMGSGKKKFLRS